MADSIRKMLENKEYDKLLVVELEIERLEPDRHYSTLIGQFVLLYDLIPQIALKTILMDAIDLRQYFGKFLKQEKGRDEEGTLKLLHFWGFEKIKKNGKMYYNINSEHKLNILDGDLT